MSEKTVLEKELPHSHRRPHFIPPREDSQTEYRLRFMHELGRRRVVVRLAIRPTYRGKDAW